MASPPCGPTERVPPRTADQCRIREARAPELVSVIIGALYHRVIATKRTAQVACSKEMAAHATGALACVRRNMMLIGLVLACALGPRATAHEIPSDAKINMFVRPSGTTLSILLRVPLSAMQEVDFPRRGPGYLEVSRADEALRNATQLWLVNNLTVLEN